MLSRIAGLFVFQKGVGTSQIALTFDDGPSEKYTNELLDILKFHQIKASFFVVGENAEKNPDILKRMHSEGHLIGIHNYKHQCNWLLAPWSVKHGVEKTAKIIETITGTKPCYYRPPWGMMNFFDLFIHQYHIILWSLMVGDWKSDGGSKKIETRLLKRIKPGDIIVLHDNGATWGAEEDAPKYMIEALTKVLKELSERGYEFSRIDELIKK